MNPIAISVTGITLVLLLIAGSCSSVSVVETGHRGVKTVFGKVTGDPVPEGIYFNSPFSTAIHQIDIRTQRLDGDTQAYTKDVQTASMKYVVNYSVDPTKAGEIYKTVGTSYAEKLIPPMVEGSIKSALGRWEAVELIANREKARAEVQSFLTTQLAPRGIIVEGFQIMNIDYSKQFEEAVEAKVVAVQSAEQAHNKTVQVQEEANQRLIAAKADAEAMKIKSEALSQSPALVNYEAVQKWNGILPQYVLGGAIPMLNMNTK